MCLFRTTYKHIIIDTHTVCVPAKLTIVCWLLLLSFQAVFWCELCYYYHLNFLWGSYTFKFQFVHPFIPYRFTYYCGISVTLTLLMHVFFYHIMPRMVRLFIYVFYLSHKFLAVCNRYFVSRSFSSHSYVCRYFLSFSLLIDFSYESIWCVQLNRHFVRTQEINWTKLLHRRRSHQIICGKNAYPTTQSIDFYFFLSRKWNGI